jgi:hypothetical protein
MQVIDANRWRRCVLPIVKIIVLQTVLGDIL